MPYPLHHISYAVRSTDEAIAAFAPLYPRVVTRRVLEPSQQVYVTYLAQESTAPYIELVEPASPESPVRALVAERPSTLYHLCYAVPHFGAALEEMKAQGFFMISKPFKSEVDPGNWASHFFHPQAGTIEIMGPGYDHD